MALVVIAVAAAYVRLGDAPSDILMNIAVLSVGGFLCAEIGKRTPGLRNLGLAAILATFVPSYLVYAHLLPAPIIKSISAFSDNSNFLYLFIAAVIVGSILGMDRRLLIAGFLRIFAPLVAGSIVATAVGCAVGWALGLGLQHSFFMIVAPIMAGGVGEGAIPLTVGYALFSHQPQGELFAQVLPAVMFGSLTAIILAGTLNFVGKRYPSLTGEGRLQVGEQDVDLTAPIDRAADAGRPPTLGAALLLAVTLYLVGALAQKLWHWPAPVVMLGLAVAMKLGRVASPRLEEGAYANFLFFSTCVTYPLLFAIGVSKTPWEKLIAAFNLPTAGDEILGDGDRADGDGLCGRAVRGHVSDRRGDSERLPLGPGRHRGRGDPHRRQPHAADAVRPDRHPDRWRDHGHADPGRVRQVRRLAGGRGRTAAQGLVEGHAVDRLDQLGDEQGLARRIQGALRVEQGKVAVDAAVVARLGQALGDRRGLDQPLLGRYPVLDGGAHGQRVGDLAEGGLHRLFVLGDGDVAAGFGAVQIGAVGAAVEDRQADLRA